MELILISKSKLKIMMSAEDMKTYNIECDGENAFGRGFRPVLEKARRDCGFECEGGRLLVQVFPSRAGGCEMFITRVTPQNDCALPKKKELCAVIFRRASEMISACALLNARGYCGESRAYSLPTGECVLWLEEPDPDRELALWAAVAEYGEKCKGKDIEMYIKEHASEIFEENAVSALSGFC